MGKYGFRAFASEQWRTVPPVLRTDLSGKTLIVVGANAGIGLETSKHLASMNPARLIMACRNKDKGEAAVAKVKEATGFDAELWLLDLAKFSSVIDFANKFEKDGLHLDILIMNAGIALSDYQATSDGWESTIQVNHLSTALLPLLLLPRMAHNRNDSPTALAPRLVIVSSDVHSWVKIDKVAIDAPNALETLGGKEYSLNHMGTRYYLSKLLNVFFVRAFNDHLSAPVVTIDALSPGFCYSEMRSSLRGFKAMMSRIFEMLFALTSEQGSRVVVRAAIWDMKDEELRGQYISAEAIKEPSVYVLSQEGRVAQERIWNETVDILSEVDPRVKTIVNKYMGTPPSS